jgi:GGDEF domain-containing protein
MAARYDDAGRFAIYINYCSPGSLQGTADKLRSLVESSSVIWEDEAIYLTLSIGIVNHKINNELTVDSLMVHAEQVLDESRSAPQQRAKVA